MAYENFSKYLLKSKYIFFKLLLLKFNTLTQKKIYMLKNIKQTS